MAKQAKAEGQPEPQVEERPAQVKYEDLILSKVEVVDAAGNVYYLDPSIRNGDFVLRVKQKAA